MQQQTHTVAQSSSPGTLPLSTPHSNTHSATTQTQTQTTTDNSNTNTSNASSPQYSASRGTHTHATPLLASPSGLRSPQRSGAITDGHTPGILRLDAAASLEMHGQSPAARELESLRQRVKSLEYSTTRLESELADVKKNMSAEINRLNIGLEEANRTCDQLKQQSDKTGEHFEKLVAEERAKNVLLRQNNQALEDQAQKVHKMSHENSMLRSKVSELEKSSTKKQ
eukprot:c5204_g1_i2.p1 GENE.c5204_g1_i2~~c5204_g1_i2.p1  ORF type:complete len:236 (-),score=64.60 c5204_g1_i2:137-814(-)